MNRQEQIELMDECMEDGGVGYASLLGRHHRHASVILGWVRGTEFETS